MALSLVHFSPFSAQNDARRRCNFKACLTSTPHERAQSGPLASTRAELAENDHWRVGAVLNLKVDGQLSHPRFYLGTRRVA